MMIKTYLRGLTALLGLALADLACANAVNTQTQSVPTLDEIGLTGLVTLVGVVAGIVIRRRGKK
jgi:hypothetical protein